VPPHVEHSVVAVLTMMVHHLDIAAGERRHGSYVPPHVGASWRLVRPGGSGWVNKSERKRVQWRALFLVYGS